MTTPRFSSQPDENTKFSPRIVKYIKSLDAVPIVVDGIFDILVTKTKDYDDKYIELKVCLATQNRAIPISRKQWHFIRSQKVHSVINDRFRYFVYDYGTKKYLFCEAEDLRDGLQKTIPSSTSYIRQKHLKNLNWLPPKEAYFTLAEWINGYNNEVQPGRGY